MHFFLSINNFVCKQALTDMLQEFWEEAVK